MRYRWWSLVLVFAVFSAEAAEKEHVARLKYSRGRFDCWNSTDFGSREIVFKNEPDFKGFSVMRGHLPCGEEEDEIIPFAFVRDAVPANAKAFREGSELRLLKSSGRKTGWGVLLLDLNRNWDLTDDTAGRYEHSSDSGAFVKIKHIEGGVSVPSVAAVYCHFYSFSGGGEYRSVSTTHEYGWVGTVELAGKRWSLAVVDDLDGIHDSDDLFVLKPYLAEDWEDERGIVRPMFDSDERLRLPLPHRLVLDGIHYKIEYAYEQAGDEVEQVVTFTETSFPTEEVSLASTHVDQLMLFGADKRDTLAVVLDRPGSVVDIPAETYGKQRIFLDNGKKNGIYMAQSGRDFVVREGTRSVLKLGTPLTPTVTAEQGGRDLLLQFNLVGLSGEKYLRLDTSRVPENTRPRFVIAHKGVEVVTGKFEYG